MRITFIVTGVSFILLHSVALANNFKGVYAGLLYNHDIHSLKHQIIMPLLPAGMGNIDTRANINNNGGIIVFGTLIPAVHNIVIGLEANAFIASSAGISQTNIDMKNNVYQFRIQPLVELNGRVGYVINEKIMLYGKIGFMVSRHRVNPYSNLLNSTNSNQSNLADTVEDKGLLWAPVFGGGLEWAVIKNLNIRAEYSMAYYSTGTVNRKDLGGININYDTARDGTDKLTITDHSFRVGIVLNNFNDWL